MTQLEEASGVELELRAREGATPPADLPTARARATRVNRVSAISTGLVVALAGLLAWKMWDAYQLGPWTRDATVRAYVITEVPEVSGQITQLAVYADQYVHKGDLLLAIDPTDYEIAVSQSEATVRQAQANVQNIDAQITVQHAQTNASQAQLQQGQAALVFAEQQAERYQTLAEQGWGTVQNAQQFTSQLHQQEAAVQSAQENLNQALRQVESRKAQRLSAEASLAQAKAQLNQAQVNLKRTRIVSPVNGYVTNLTAQVGDYATAGHRVLTVVNTDSFWVEAYFEETQLEGIHLGDSVETSLMGHSSLLKGHVESVSRGIEVANAQSGDAGLASVNPVYTWIRLAQRVPVRISIDEVPPSVTLVVGLTATVRVGDSDRRPAAYVGDAEKK